jgi:hypothetical protein
VRGDGRSGTDARSLRTDLQRKLAPPADGLHLDLCPDPAYRSLNTWGRKLAFPPCRLIWIGDVLAAPDDSHSMYVEALVDPLTESGEELPEELPFEVFPLPLTALRFLTVARVLAAYGGQQAPPPYLLKGEWSVDLWISCPETVIVTTAEFPALAIATLALYPRFATVPLCVMADRRAGLLLIVPCWEIFRFYYAYAFLVARRVFEFPMWTPEMLGRMLKHFDGHLFRWPCSRAAGSSRVATGYAELQLKTIGRDAVVAYAQMGRAQIRAVPPFLGSAWLRCIGVPVRLGEFEALFVQQILGSEPQYGEPGVIRWMQPLVLRR